MPWKPTNPCRYPMCPNTTRSGYCDDHKDYEKSVKANYEKCKGKSDDFYRSTKWRKFRHWYVNVKGNSLCVKCLEEGRGPVTMKILDHIKEIKDGGAKLDPENVQSLCQECHNRVTAERKKLRGKWAAKKK